MLTILHTSDWHLGKEYRQFDEPVSLKLSQERLRTVEKIMRLGQQRNVDAVLCAGDLFDTHDPKKDWWQGLLDLFAGFRTWNTPVILLPGNHDPLMSGSVYESTHPFRRNLPDWARVVDSENWGFVINDRAVVYSTPCFSKAGAPDAAMKLPTREAGDERIRIGLIHGQTWDRSAAHFPISKQAAAERGLDYLALGDTHSFEEVTTGETGPIVYCGTPEPSRFGEDAPGKIVFARFRRAGQRPQIDRQHVGRFHWREEKINRLSELADLVQEDLSSAVLRLKLHLTVSVAEDTQLERLLDRLRGTDALPMSTAAFQCERDVRVSMDDLEIDPAWPQTIQEVAHQLKSDADPKSQRALLKLLRLVNELSEAG
jgi:DNA repair exonuclease SbcCD nuclease subunit